jgi:hypothetical protein
MAYDSSFQVGYDPNRTLNAVAQIGLPDTGIGQYGAGGGFSGNFNADIGGLLDTISRYRKRAQDQQMARQLQMQKLTAQQQRNALIQNQRLTPPLQRQAQDQAAATSIAQSQAARQAAPMHWVTGIPGVAGFTEPDIKAMTPFQRQAFLPQQSTSIGGGGGGETMLTPQNTALPIGTGGYADLATQQLRAMMQYPSFYQSLRAGG